LTRSIFCKDDIITATTPLFVALVVIEVMDVVLLNSVPAILAIDPARKN
jgi:predicted tellurium resistance membrane protein TerC